jgi:nitroimidazol reductase NimA-like FMN-containing flavoprotein (pyridoxamine 5'-phosphate oxidase superfamily)
MNIKGPWSAAQIRRHLDESIIPARVAVLTPGGAPLVLSLWFMHRDGAIWCACNRRARLVKLLERDPRCGFEIAAEAPPYRGVRGQGTATLAPPRGAEVLAALLARYRVSAHSTLAATLTSEAARGNEMAIRIDPAWMTSWDFSARMADAFAA